MRLTERDIGIVREAISELIGLPLSDWWCASVLWVFEFGPQVPFTNHYGKPAMHSETWLDAYHEWTITCPDGQEVTSQQFGSRSHRDEERVAMLCSLIRGCQLILESVDVLDTGTLVLRLTGGYGLTILPNRNWEPRNPDWRYKPADEAVRGSLCLYGDSVAWVRAEEGPGT